MLIACRRGWVYSAGPGMWVRDSLEHACDLHGRGMPVGQTAEGSAIVHHAHDESKIGLHAVNRVQGIGHARPVLHIS